MEKTIDSQFQRVEKALSTLITSIATYNPNPKLATELVTADQKLTEGLEQLTIHQQNYARILALRSESAALDAQIKGTLSVLVETRSELINTPATEFPKDPNPVSYSELLSYARRISKFTRPTAFREVVAESPPADTALASTEPEVKIEGPSDSQALGTLNSFDSKPNGSATPAIANGSVPPSSLANQTSQDVDLATTQNTESTTALPPAVSEWLNPLNGEAPFVPWPTEETIRRGALASIQILLNQGVDPATFDPARMEELELEKKRLEEEAELAKANQEEERARVRAEQERERREVERKRRESAIAAGGSGEGGERFEREMQQAVFTGLDILDDMDEDDD